MIRAPEVSHIFFYGFFKNDNHAGKAVTNDAIQDMDIRCAGQISGAKLVDDYFAAVVLERPGYRVLGQVLSCNDPQKFK